MIKLHENRADILSFVIKNKRKNNNVGMAVNGPLGTVTQKCIKT